MIALLLWRSSLVGGLGAVCAAWIYAHPWVAAANGAVAVYVALDTAAIIYGRVRS